MTTPSKLDEARLRELAEAALSPGGDTPEANAQLVGNTAAFTAWIKANGDYHQACQPATILALLDALSAERKRGDRAVETLELLDSWKSIMPVTVQRMVRKGLATQKAEGAET